jgi:acyl-CoA synthetase (AMP-forming)/AMP-acid ligase II
MTNIVSLLIENADSKGDTIALIEGNVKLSYKQLLNTVKVVASRLERKGISKNDRVLMFIPMSIELYVFILAVWYRGASVLFVDAWADLPRIEKAFDIIPCIAFIGSPKAHLLRVVSKKIRKIQTNIWALLSDFKDDIIPDIVPVETAPEDTALVTLTTGSTGVPKAANRTHGFLLSQHGVLKNHMQPQGGDIECICLPVFVLNCLASGNSACIPPINPAKPYLFKPEKIVRMLKDHSCTTIIASPVFFEKLATYCSEKKIVPGIRRAFLGGAQVFGASAKKITDAFKNTDVEIVYGSTEAEPIAFIKAADLCSDEKKNVSMDGLLAGKPSPHIRIAIVKIIDRPIGPISHDEFARISCAANMTGEIVVHGDHVLKEYLNCPDAQLENKFSVDGEVWHRTGDAGYLDFEGNLHLMGRVKQRIVVKDKEIFSLTVELKLCKCKQISMGTILEIENQVYCVVELNKNEVLLKQEIMEIIKQFGIDSDEQIIQTTIPRDPRHHSKIDYDRLNIHVRKHLKNRHDRW